MSLFNLYDDEVSIEELRQLISNKICEKRTIDYKQTLELVGDENRKEFLADIVSFANTNGGILIYGMREDAGLPVDLIGITSGNFDILKGQIESIIRDGIAPKLNTIKVIDVIITENNKAIIIKIPQSWASPHLVWFKRSSKFFARNSSHGKYQLEISEIRSSIIASENLYEKIRNFRLDRVSKLLNNQTPVLMNGNPKFVIHIIPFNSFNYANQIDMSSEKWSNLFNSNYYSNYREKHNFDGYVIHNQFDTINPADHYTQYFRNGEIEIVDTTCTYIKDGNKLIYSSRFENIFQEDIPIAALSLLSFNLGFPVIITLSILGIKDYTMGYYNPNYHSHGSFPIDKDNLLINEIIIQKYDDLKNPVSYKPLFDPIWNACGFVRSLNFNANGEQNP